MCSICHMSRCPSGCPNAPDPPAVTTCVRCGEPITPGNEYARIGGLDYCESCIDDMPLCQLIPLLGWEWKTVESGEDVRCYDCSCCGIEEPIPVGTEYGLIDGNAFCEECIDEIPYSELVTRAGHDWKTASEEDVYDGYDG